ncbi:hypothetical protein [Thalassolituus sp.]|uniref:hypothetical protein n=1 Tax=Thalassolituus sp. TaxID=2030822 RepID=UPI0035129E7A
MVKKTLLGLAIAAAAVGLSGCKTGGDSSVDQTAITAGSTNPDTVTPVFNVARRNLPLATDFLFSGSTDGTVVYASGDVEIFLADGTRNPDYNPVFDAISDLDGFSTVAPLYLKFSGELAAGTAPAGSVYLIPMNYTDGPKLGTLDTANPFDLANIAAVKAEVISYADGDMTDNVLRISPTTPLQNDTRYLVVLTDRLKDSDGEATKLPNQYKYLIGDDDLLNPALAPARAAMKGWYQLATGFLASADASANVTLAYTFTTGGTTEVLNVMAAAKNADDALENPFPASVQLVVNSNDAATAVGILTAAPFNLPLANAQAAVLYGTLPSPSPRESDFSAAVPTAMAKILSGTTTPESTFLTGTIELPYYSQAPLGAFADDGIAANPAANDNYTCADTANTSCLAAKATAAGVVAGQWEADTDVIYDLQIALGATEEVAAAYKAPSENVTNLFPFAKEQGRVDVPVMVVEPNTGSCTKPGAGWPVVIYQHGITSNRMSIIPLAEQFAASCFATVAIDLPMHGLMPTDLVSSGAYAGAPFNGVIPMMAAVNESAGGADVPTFAGLDASTQAQVIGGETLKQRHFGLTAAADGATPTAVTGAETDASGSLYISFLHFQTTRDNNRQAVMDLLNLNASLSSMDIDNDSGTTDFDTSKVYFAGVSLGSTIGMQFVAVNNANVANNSVLNPIQKAVFGVPGGGLPKLLENSQTFGSSITNALTNPDSFNLTQGGESYESLLYVYQATVDSADAINFAAQLKATATPFTLIESVGDTVIPNNVASAPLAGTDPLIAVTGATQIDTSSTFSATDQVYLKLADEYSSHTSMAVPDTDANTPETTATFGLLAQHIISFFSGAGVLTDGGSGLDIVEPVSE